MPAVSPRSIALAHALGRVAIGSALTVQPARAGALWVGSDARRPAARVLAAAMGARDAAIGAAILTALQRGGDARPLVAGGVVSDFVDLVATVRAGRDLPPAAAAGVGALATGSVALGAWVYARLG